jgi:hypothetical protein
MLDRFSFDLGGVKVGDPASPMHIAPEWRGLPALEIAVEIAQIRGCDVAPLDLTDPAQALRLKSYVWAETTERLHRIDAAIALATQRPPDVVRQDAAEFVAQVIGEPVKYGEGRALFHSIVWQYLPPETRSTITTAMERAGAEATAQSPLAWVKVETNRETFRHEIRVRYWPGGEEETVLGTVHAHGAWLEWLAP